MSTTGDSRLAAHKLTVRRMSPLDARVAVLGSKSYTNRYLAIASLSGQETVIDHALLSGNARTQEHSLIINAIRAQADTVITVVDERPDAMHITGGRPHSATINTHGDHRIAMSFAIAGLRTGGAVITKPGCLAKSLPIFWRVLDAPHPEQSATRHR